MKINFTLMIFIFACLLVNSQDNLPLKFSGDAVKWSELQWIEGNRTEDQRFTYRVPPIIVDDTIYLFNNYQGLFDNNVSAGYCGYTIKKLNKTTGTKYWEVQRQYKEIRKRKAISQPSLEAGQLIVTLFDEAPESGIGTDWNRCYPAHIAINRSSGIILDSNYVDRNIANLPFFYATLDPSNAKNSQIYFNDSNYTFRYYESGIRTMIINLVAQEGDKLQSDSITMKFKYNARQFRHYNLNNEYLYVISLRDSANYTKKEFLFNKYDHELNLLTSVDFSDSVNLPDPVTFITSFPVSSEYFVIGVNSQVANPLKYESRYFMFDGNGALVDKLTFTINGDPNIEYGWHRPLVDVVNKKLLLTRSQQDIMGQSTKFNIFMADGNTIRSIKEIEVEGIDDHFRTTYHQMLDNGDILLFIDQFDWADQNIRWFSWILLDGQKMGIVSSSNDTESVNKTLKIYPNPSSGKIQIDHLHIPASVTISNLNGQIMKSLSDIENEINITDLPKGMYIIDIKNKEISERHKIVKVE